MSAEYNRCGHIKRHIGIDWRSFEFEIYVKVKKYKKKTIPP